MLTFDGTVNYAALAIGISLGFAIFLPVMSQLQSSLRKNGNRS